MDLNVYEYDKDKIKSALSIEDVRDLMEELGGEPTPVQGNFFTSKTISHGGDSHKLYYYQNDEMGIFKDYTADDSFDLFELIRRVKSQEGGQWDLPRAVSWVAARFGFLPEASYNAFEQSLIKEDLIYLSNIDRINKIELKTQTVEMAEYQAPWLNNLANPRLLGWESEGIKKEINDAFNIRYHAGRPSIIIPHYDENDRLIGIRERELDEERILRFGKYHPTHINGTIYSHPLSFALYGLNKAAPQIKQMKKAILFESEKAVLQYCSFFGLDNTIACAACGSSISAYQVKLLKDRGAEEIIVGFDKAGSKQDTEKYVKKFYNFQKKYGNQINLSFIYDSKDEFLDWKMAPTDNGKETFLELYKRRIVL